MPQLVCFGWRAYRRGEGGNTSNVALPGRPRLRLVRCFAYSDGGTCSLLPRGRSHPNAWRNAVATTQEAIRKPLPFDAARLDRLMDEAGIDVLVATSKHNVQYLLGGYRFFFFDDMDAIGVSRYLPVLVYRKGKPEEAAYVGCAMENFEKELDKFWPAALSLGDTGSQAAMQQAVAHIKKLGGVRRVGIETAFLPADAEGTLRQGLSNVDIVDAVVPLERLRARKTAARAGLFARGLGTRHRIHAGDPQAVQARRRQGRDLRNPAARGGEPQPGVRLLPADGRHEPQPRAFRAAARGRRHSLARQRGQLQGLHRRPVPHGNCRQAGCGARGPAGFRRGGAAGDTQAHPQRRARRRHHCARREDGGRVAARRHTPTTWRTAWGSSATRRRG